MNLLVNLIYQFIHSYKCYEVLTGDVVPVPKDPVLEEKTFIGWFDAEGNALDQSMMVTQNTAYYAKWN